jgi:hypothetical protein
VVTITGLSLAAATNNTVTVKAATQATQATSVTAVASTSSITPVTSSVFTTTGSHNTVTITLTGGTFKTGTITEADFTFAGDNAVALASGNFTRTSNTVVTITGLSLLAATNNTVTVKAATQATQASTVTAAASTTTLNPVTSSVFSTTTAHNVVTITLTGGTFKAGPIIASDFIFAGTNQAVIEGGIFNRISNTVVTVTGLSLATASDNLVTVKAATQVTQATSVSGAASTVTPVISTAFTTTATDNAVTITLTGGTFKAGAIAASDFIFTGTNNGVLSAATDITRVSDTVVTITGLTLAVATDNQVTVKAEALSSQATSVSAAASGITAVTSAEFTTNSGNSNITISLTGGVFKAGTIAASDFTFAGNNSVALGAATNVTRVSDTVVTISGLNLAAATNNTVTVKAATQATQASSVSVTAATVVPVSSSAFTTAAENDTVTIYLVGGSFKSSIAATDFTFTGSNGTALEAGTFTRIGDSIVTISIDSASPLSISSDNIVTVKAATQATQASAVIAVASSKPIEILSITTTEVGAKATKLINLTPASLTVTARNIGTFGNSIGVEITSTSTDATSSIASVTDSATTTTIEYNSSSTTGITIQEIVDAINASSTLVTAATTVGTATTTATSSVAMLTDGADAVLTILWSKVIALLDRNDFTLIQTATSTAPTSATSTVGSSTSTLTFDNIADVVPIANDNKLEAAIGAMTDQFGNVNVKETWKRTSGFWVPE